MYDNFLVFFNILRYKLQNILKQIIMKIILMWIISLACFFNCILFSFLDFEAVQDSRFKILYSHKPMHYNGSDVFVYFFIIFGGFLQLIYFPFTDGHSMLALTKVFINVSNTPQTWLPVCTNLPIFIHREAKLFPAEPKTHE